MKIYTEEEISMTTERVSLKDLDEKDFRIWTVAELIADLKRSKLTDDGIVAYLFGLEIENQIELPESKGMTLSQFKNILIER